MSRKLNCGLCLSDTVGELLDYHTLNVGLLSDVYYNKDFMNKKVNCGLCLRVCSKLNYDTTSICQYCQHSC